MINTATVMGKEKYFDLDWEFLAAGGYFGNLFVFTTITIPSLDALSPAGVGSGGLVGTHKNDDFVFGQPPLTLDGFKRNRITPGHEDNLFNLDIGEIPFFHETMVLHLLFGTIGVMRKIWNRPNQTVWSLATVDEDGIGNMNICTYVTSVSMDPKLMMVAVYHGTKTHANIVATKRAVLQLLPETLAPVIRICGHKSGNKIDKIKRLQKRYAIAAVEGIPVFGDCAGYLELVVQQLLSVGGDHDLAICNVRSHKNTADVPLLTTAYLRAKGLLR